MEERPRADESSQYRSSRRSILRTAGATALATAGVVGLSGQAAAVTSVGEKKTNSDEFSGYYRPSTTNYDGGLSLSANKREYESTSNYVTYRFDLTGTFEALTNDGDAWVDQFGFRLDFDSQFDSPVTVDFIDSPASSERVQSGIDLSGTSYDASGATEAAIEVAITELIVAAGFVSSSYVTVGSLMWALFKGFNTSVTNDDNEVRFNKNLGDPYRKRANLGYHGLELTLDPSETEGVTIEAFNDTGGYTYSTSEHFYLNDH